MGGGGNGPATFACRNWGEVSGGLGVAGVGDGGGVLLPEAGIEGGGGNSATGGGLANCDGGPLLVKPGAGGVAVSAPAPRNIRLNFFLIS